jgi:hypothetical protein
VRENELLNDNIEEDRSTRNMDHGQLSKRKNPSTDALEHHAGKQERQAHEALKMQVELT